MTPCDRFHRPNALSVFCLLLLSFVLTGEAMAQVDFGFGVPKNAPPVFNDSRDQVTASILPSRTEVAPGADFIIAVVLDAESGWHLWPGPGAVPKPYVVFESAIRTEISLPEGDSGPIELHPGFTIWPEVHGVEADLGDGPLNYGVYEGWVGILIPATVAADAAPGPREISIEVSFQTCDDQFCLAPADETLQTTVTIVAAGTMPSGVNNDDDPVFARFDPSVFAGIRGGELAPEVVDFDVFGLTFSLDAAVSHLAVAALVIYAH